MDDILTPQLLTKEAKSAYRAGDFSTAARYYEAARQGYLTIDDALMAAEMANNCSVALLQAGENKAALQVVEGTDIVFIKTGDRKRQAIALGNQAAALEALGRIDEAEQKYWKAANIFKDLGETELRYPLMQSISRIQLSTGRQLQAVASMYAGINNIEKPTGKQRLLKRLLKIPFQLIDNQSKELPDDTNDHS